MEKCNLSKWILSRLLHNLYRTFLFCILIEKVFYHIKLPKQSKIGRWKQRTELNRWWAKCRCVGKMVTDFRCLWPWSWWLEKQFLGDEFHIYNMMQVCLMSEHVLFLYYFAHSPDFKKKKKKRNFNPTCCWYHRRFLSIYRYFYLWNVTSFMVCGNSSLFMRHLLHRCMHTATAYTQHTTTISRERKKRNNFAESISYSFNLKSRIAKKNARTNEKKNEERINNRC